VSQSLSIDDVLPATCRGLRQVIRGVLYRYRIPVEDAEDLVQSVLLLAVSNWSEIRDPKAWLLGTLYHRCIVYWRQRRLHQSRFVQLDAADDVAAAPAQDRWELLADVGTATCRLPATQRRLVVLRFQLGLTLTEATEATGLARSSGQKILQRALARLREQLDEPRPGRAARRPLPPAWSAAMETWLSALDVSSATSRSYRLHVTAAGAAMGRTLLAELTAADLAAFRAGLLADGRAPGTCRGMLRVIRCFLLWAGERGLHAVDAESVRRALRTAAGRHRPRQGA
jgi:RNA polymerase sigma factor (sigma-70 family)